MKIVKNENKENYLDGKTKEKKKCIKRKKKQRNDLY